MLITNGTIVTPGVRRRTIKREFNLGPMALRVVSITIIAAAVLVAVIQTTTAATKAYEVNDLEAQKHEKQSDIADLAAEGQRLQALRTVTDTQPSPSPSPTLEASGNVNFLAPSASPSPSENE
jgi:hypothetical protein